MTVRGAGEESPGGNGRATTGYPMRRKPESALFIIGASMKYKEFFGKKVKVKLKNDDSIKIGWLFYGAHYGCPRSFVLVEDKASTCSILCYDNKSIEDIKLYE